MSDTGASEGSLRSVLAAISSSVKPVQVPARGAAPSASPFITISRQAGAGGRALAARLVEHLAQRDRADPPWRSYDRELVEKVAADHHLARHLIESLEDGAHSWLDDVFAGLSTTAAQEPAEFSVYRRVAATIRTLAHDGRAIIVGRGGVYVTRNMPGGVHVRLVAPLEHRIEHQARLLNLSHRAAADWVRQTDQHREGFYRRYFGHQGPPAELFTITINTAAVADDRAAQAILPLVGASPAGASVDTSQRARAGEAVT